MFIRTTIKIDPKTDKKYFSYQLVESYRSTNGPRQKILLTIGSDIALNEDERKLLANRIEEIIIGSTSLFIYPESIETLAQHYAELILQKNKLPKDIEEPSSSNNDADFQDVDINSIRHSKVRTIGCEYVAYSAFQELHFNELFDQLKFSIKQKAIAAAAIIGRAVHPSSERSLHSWLKSHSALDELLQTSFAKTSLDQFYFISDDLYRAKKSLERHLRKREKHLFNLQETIILYDITNTYFEGSCKSHKKAKRGKSKEMRSDCPLLALGVVLDAEGFPKHSEIFDGNVNERATLQEMIRRLNDSEMATSPIIVLDSGIATKDNIAWLKAQGYLYIVMMKRKDRPPVNKCKEVIIRDNREHFISASLAHDNETGDHLLWCYSEQRRLKEQDIKQYKTSSLEHALTYLKEGLNCARRIKALDKVHQKIGRLRQKYSRLAQHYDILVQPSEDGKNAVDITWSYDASKIERSFSGTYTLRTNVRDLSSEKIWEIYVMLSEAESCFRCLKSEAGLRPNWHHREDRMDSHIFISILAYHLIASIRKKLRDHGIHDSWETIREGLQTHALVRTSMNTKEGGMIYIKQTSDPSEYQQSIYRALGLSLKPMKAEKTIIRNTNVVSKVC